MIRRPPRSTRTDTLFPYTTLFLSTGDRLLRLGNHGLLPRDQLHFRSGEFDLLLVLDRVAHAHVERDLLNLRDFHRILVTDFLGHRLDDLVFIELPHARGVFVSHRSEESRVGKECLSKCGSWCSPEHYKKKYNK